MQRLIDQHPLQRGSHPDRGAGMCAMEMVAWLAGEPHSDEPRCACPVLGAFVRACNDAMSDEARNRHLRPQVPQLVNTRATVAIERRRGFVVLDGLVRVLVPKALRRDRLFAEADLLSGFAPVVDLEGVRTARRAIEHYGRRQHAAQWVLNRAAEGLPPQRFVAGVVTVARQVHDAATWPLLATWIERMAAIGIVADGALQQA
ncbi:MAG: hypothetical protein JNK15_06935 [Planctomycetes bacterium]|nr:hypothetical protein [Planctomycetota bacterium]